MLSSSIAPIANIIGWAVLPSFLSTLLLRGLYTVLPSSKPTSPAAASRHAKMSYVLVIAVYLCHTLVNTYHTVFFDQPNAYHILGLKVIRPATLQGELWDTNLRTHWRGLAKEFHPDKTGGSLESETTFVALRSAYEVLSDPVKRAAHDRFGPDTLSVCAGKCIAYRDYWIRGLQASAGFYVATLVSLLLLTLTKSVEYGTYWRYISFFALFSAEYSLLNQPSWSISTLERLPYLSNLTTHQTILILHQLYVILNCALSQVGPVLWPAKPSGAQKDLQEMAPAMMRLRAGVQSAHMETLQLMRGDLQPLLQMAVESSLGQEEFALEATTSELKEAMVQALVELRLKSDRRSRDAWRDAVKRETAAAANEQVGLHHHHHHVCGDEAACDGATHDQYQQSSSETTKVKKEELDVEDSFVSAAADSSAVKVEDQDDPAAAASSTPQTTGSLGTDDMPSTIESTRQDHAESK